MPPLILRLDWRQRRVLLDCLLACDGSPADREVAAQLAQQLVSMGPAPVASTSGPSGPVRGDTAWAPHPWHRHRAHGPLDGGASRITLMAGVICWGGRERS